MNSKRLVTWFSTVSIILVLWGAAFALFGLGELRRQLCTGMLAHAQLRRGFLGCPVDQTVLLAWESALYGAIMIGWGTTLFLVGRVALRRRDDQLIKPLLAGIAVWLLVEAVFSARYGVWFNIGVDVSVLALFSVPLIASLRAPDAGTGTRQDV